MSKESRPSLAKKSLSSRFFEKLGITKKDSLNTSDHSNPDNEPTLLNRAQNEKLYLKAESKRKTSDPPRHNSSSMRHASDPAPLKSDPVISRDKIDPSINLNRLTEENPKSSKSNTHEILNIMSLEQPNQKDLSTNLPVGASTPTRDERMGESSRMSSLSSITATSYDYSPTKPNLEGRNNIRMENHSLSRDRYYSSGDDDTDGEAPLAMLKLPTIVKNSKKVDVPTTETKSSPPLMREKVDVPKTETTSSPPLRRENVTIDDPGEILRQRMASIQSYIQRTNSQTTTHENRQVDKAQSQMDYKRELSKSDSHDAVEDGREKASQVEFPGDNQEGTEDDQVSGYNDNDENGDDIVHKVDSPRDGESDHSQSEQFDQEAGSSEEEEEEVSEIIQEEKLQNDQNLDESSHQSFAHEDTLCLSTDSEPEALALHKPLTYEGCSISPDITDSSLYADHIVQPLVVEQPNQTKNDYPSPQVMKSQLSEVSPVVNYPHQHSLSFTSESEDEYNSSLFNDSFHQQILLSNSNLIDHNSEEKISNLNQLLFSECDFPSAPDNAIISQKESLIPKIPQEKEDEEVTRAITVDPGIENVTPQPLSGNNNNDIGILSEKEDDETTRVITLDAESTPRPLLFQSLSTDNNHDIGNPKEKDDYEVTRAITVTSRIESTPPLSLFQPLSNDHNNDIDSTRGGEYSIENQGSDDLVDIEESNQIETNIPAIEDETVSFIPITGDMILEKSEELSPISFSEVVNDPPLVTNECSVEILRPDAIPKVHSLSPQSEYQDDSRNLSKEINQAEEVEIEKYFKLGGLLAQTSNLATQVTEESKENKIKNTDRAQISNYSNTSLRKNSSRNTPNQTPLHHLAQSYPSIPSYFNHNSQHFITPKKHISFSPNISSSSSFSSSLPNPLYSSNEPSIHQSTRKWSPKYSKHRLSLQSEIFATSSSSSSDDLDSLYFFLGNVYAGVSVKCSVPSNH